MMNDEAYAVYMRDTHIRKEGKKRITVGKNSNEHNDYKFTRVQKQTNKNTNHNYQCGRKYKIWKQKVEQKHFKV